METPEVGFANEFDYLLGIFRRRIIECETLIILIPLKVAEAWLGCLVFVVELDGL